MGSHLCPHWQACGAHHIQTSKGTTCLPICALLHGPSIPGRPSQVQRLHREMLCIFTSDLADVREGRSQRLTRDPAQQTQSTESFSHGADRMKYQQSELPPLICPGGSWLNLHISPPKLSSIYKSLALCNFIWLQSQRGIENLILEPSVEQVLLPSGLSAPCAWGRAYMARGFPALTGALRLTRSSTRHQNTAWFSISALCACACVYVCIEKEGVVKGEEYRF